MRLVYISQREQKGYRRGTEKSHLLQIEFCVLVMITTRVIQERVKDLIQLEGTCTTIKVNFENYLVNVERSLSLSLACKKIWVQ